jgi:hypothetical protein
MNRPGVVVTLTWSELFIAGLHGMKRHIESCKRGRRNASGYNGEDSWTVDIEGVAGEWAFAKFRGTFYFPHDEPDQDCGDVEGYQIKHTRYQDGHLLIQLHNPPGIYILVVGELAGKNPCLRIVGWTDSEEARRNYPARKLKAERPPVHAVPQSALHPIETLPDRNAYTASPTIENYTRPVETPGREHERHPPECFCDSCCRTA